MQGQEEVGMPLPLLLLRLISRGPSDSPDELLNPSVVPLFLSSRSIYLIKALENHLCAGVPESLVRCKFRYVVVIYFQPDPN